MLGRFEKFYSDKEAQMIKGEERYCAKLLSLYYELQNLHLNGYRHS